MNNLKLLLSDIFPFLIVFLYVVYVDFIKFFFQNYLAEYFKVDEKNLKKIEIDLNFFKEVSSIEELQEMKYRCEELKFIFFATLFYLIILCIVVFIIAPQYSYDLIDYLKLNSENLLFRVIKSLILIFNLLLLYSGHLLEFYFYRVNPISKTGIRFWMESVYAPIIEEFIFRFVVFNILKINGHSPVKSSLISSLMFGISHLRHLLDRKPYPKKIIFQILYTGIFGFYCCYAYTYSNTIFCPMILHIICNNLQIPHFAYVHDDNYFSHNKKILTTITYISGILGFIFLTYLFH